MIVSSVSLIILYFANFPQAWLAFHILWIINAATYIFITVLACLSTARPGGTCGVKPSCFPVP